VDRPSGVNIFSKNITPDPENGFVNPGPVSNTLDGFLGFTIYDQPETDETDVDGTIYGPSGVIIVPTVPVVPTTEGVGVVLVPDEGTTLPAL